MCSSDLVTVFPDNAGSGIETHQALIQLFDRKSGVPLAVLDGRAITAWRTAAVSAIATRELARRDARTLAILGSGVQARTHFTMLQQVRRFDDVRIWSRNPENARRFAEEISAKVYGREQAVKDADVIVTATHSSEPVVRGEWLKEGAHINAIGAVGLQSRELDDVAMARSSIVVESVAAALAESGEIAHAGVPIYAELGEILAGNKAKPRNRNSLYKSLGVGIEDVAAARLIYGKVIAKQAEG